MEFVISNVDGSLVNHNTLQAKYKIYCREVSQVDLSLQGGFALIGAPVKLTTAWGNNSSTTFTVTHHSPTLPILFCIDEKGDHNHPQQGVDGKAYFPVSSRLCFLMLNADTYKFPVISNGLVPEIMWGDIRVRKSAGNGQGNYFPLASYANDQRQAWTTAPFLDQLATSKNAYTTVAHDIAYMLEQKILVLPEVKEENKITATLGVSIHPNQSTYDGRMWTPHPKKFMGEVGGIALFQNRLDPYAQPSFLAEEIIQNSKGIIPDEVDDILKMLEASERGLEGQKANVIIARQLLNSIKKHKPQEGGGDSPFSSLPPDPTHIADAIHYAIDVQGYWGTAADTAINIITTKLPGNPLCVCGHPESKHTPMAKVCEKLGCLCMEFRQIAP